LILIGGAVLATSSVLAAAGAGPVVPVPATATYAVSCRGFEAGRLNFELRAKEGGPLSTQPTRSLGCW